MAVRQWITLGGTVINEAGNEEYVTLGGWAFTEDPAFVAPPVVGTAFESTRRAFEARLSANFSALAIRYENVPWNQPDATPWVALTLLDGQAVRANLGDAALHRFPGVLQIDIFQPEYTGMKTMRDHADTIAAIFPAGTQFSAGASGTIVMGVPEFISLGVEEGWFHGVVTVPFVISRHLL